MFSKGRLTFCILLLSPSVLFAQDSTKVVTADSAGTQAHHWRSFLTCAFCEHGPA